MLTENIGVLCESVTIHAHSVYVNQTLSSLKLCEKRLLLFGVARAENLPLKGITSYPIENKTFYFNPPTDFDIHADDCLIVMGRKHHISHLRKLIDKRPLP
jgi:voltage-gated potassium channel